MLNRLRSYFALERPVFGGAGIQRELVLYSGVVIGTVGHWLFEWFTSSRAGIGTLAAGIVASVVIFQTLAQTVEIRGFIEAADLRCLKYPTAFKWAMLE